MDKIDEKLPNDFFANNSNQSHTTEFPYDPCKIKLLTDAVFYIPLQDDFPILDNLGKNNQQKNFSLLYIQPKEEVLRRNEPASASYPLQTMFECYSTSIPSYNYSEFKTIILNELQSTKSDQEIMECFLETFGYEAIDFLTEIIRNRNNRIDYSTPMYGKC